MKEGYKLLGIHSQSNRYDAPLKFEGDASEQAYDSRVLCLPGLEFAVLSSPIEIAYANYFHHILKLDVPNIVVPRNTGESLSKSFMQDADVINVIKSKQEKSGNHYVVSVFDATDTENELLQHLKRVKLDVLPEVNFPVASRLGNKAEFRKFCKANAVPQLPGGVFSSISELESFLMSAKMANLQVIIKHPYGTAGEGISIVGQDGASSLNDYSLWDSWIKNNGEVVAEVFNPGGGEHALHIYIDPVAKTPKIVGLYDQLVSKKPDGTLAHYGCRYPMQNEGINRSLTNIATERIIPALLDIGYTGPACFDVLSDPMHFMELNARSGANMYAHRIVERVAEELYGTSDVSFMFLTGLKHEITSFDEFSHKFQAVLSPQDQGTIIFTNPSRHAFGSYDIIGVSTKGVDYAEAILFNALVKIWGSNAAKLLFDKIYTR